MGKALYRKYRSKSLGEVVGQDHITTTLQNAIKSGKISHAYLFTGPRGVGKTSVARILAHSINNLPYEDDAGHIDIIEIDAASNRRIDEIRELRDKVYTAPAAAPYKVYIIDEVHMLTREAFNALLKTLEEPPSHVVFILATTDLHKLPETIVSRTQRFSFKPVPKDKVSEHLATIAKSEGIKADPLALDLLAEHGEGSFRDSISLLDQTASHSKELTVDAVHSMLGVPPKDSLQSLVSSVANGSRTEVMATLVGLYDAGYPAQLIAKELGKQLRSAMHDDTLSLDYGVALDLLEQLLAVPASNHPDRLLEIILLKQTKSDGPAQAATTQPMPTVSAPARPQPQPKTETPKEQPEPAKTLVDAPKPKPAKKITKKGDWSIEQAWPDMLTELKKHNNTLYGILRMAEPSQLDNENIELSFGFEFHKKRVAETANRKILADLLSDLTGHEVSIECLVKKDAKPPELNVKSTKQPQKAAASGPKPQNSAPIESISNIFGGAELLE